MYRQFGGSALLLLLITSAISHIGGSSAGTRSGVAVRAEAGSQGSSSAEPSAIDADRRKCYVFEVLRRYAGFGEPHLQPPAPGNSAGQKSSSTPDAMACSPSAFAEVFPSGVPGMDKKRSQVLIATVPDPLQSSEDLQFDRDIAALQEAASTAGYDFEWMMSPWQVSDLYEPKESKDAREAERYREEFGDEPGGMLFRKRTSAGKVRLQDPDDLLLIILVPESPIYGLNMAAAREGLSAVHTLLDKGFRTTPADEPEDRSRVRWIGPSYSASAPGLRTLEQEQQPHTSFDVLSGSISTSSANAFLVKLDQDANRTPKAGENKATLSELDLDALCWFMGQESRSGDNDAEPIVVLQEDETAYGGNVSDVPDSGNPCNPLRNLVRRFTFPRGISHVRWVYGGTVKSSGPSQSQEGNATSNTNVTFDFRDDLKEPLDTAPEFAPQSPVSNESVLAAIAGSIKHLHARAIVIRTSDPLDQLFLARYFRQQSPDSRLVLFNAERLLTRLHGDFSLDGTLIVTRFPLFQNSYLQTPFRGESRHSLTFTNSREESIFLAALMQIEAKPIPLLQAPYAHRLFALAPWIGVAAGGDFWPVAYFGGTPIPPGQVDPNKSLLLTDTPREPLPALWSLVLLGVLIVSLVHFLFFLIGLPLNSVLRGSKKDWVRKMAGHRLLTYYLVPQAPSCEQSGLFTGRCWWLLNVSTQLVLLLCYLLFPAITYQAKVQEITTIAGAIKYFPGQTTIFAGFTLIMLMLEFCMAGALFLLVAKQCSRPSKGLIARLGGLLLPSVSLGWTFVAVGLFCSQLIDGQSGFAFASRCLHLSSGACPVLPLILTSLGFLVASIVNLTALSMAVNRNPDLPAIDWDFLDLASWRKKLTGYTELWYGLPGADGKLLAASVLLGCLLLHPQRLFATFDAPAMAWLYTLNFVMAIWTVLWLWVRFLRIWAVLRYGLDCLEGSPLRFAFSRLPAIFSVDPIWSYAGLRRALVLPMRWLEYLKVAPDIQAVKRMVLDGNKQQMRTIIQQTEDAQWFDNLTYESFSRQQNNYAVMLSQEDAIRASWERGGPDCGPGDPPAKAKEKSGDGGTSGEMAGAPCPPCRSDVPSPCGTAFDKDNCLVEIGNEFIAMRIAAYVRYVTLHMKNLMTFMSVGFLLTLLAAISYPFNRPQMIAWAATFLLAALLFTVGTVLAQMDRNAILSRMGNSSPGKLHYGAFIKHMLAVGGLPLITLLSTLFPAIGSFLFSWVGPVLENLH